MDFWVVGFLWGTGRFSGEWFVVQETRYSLLRRVRDAVSPQTKIFKVRTESGTSWRLKLPRTHPDTAWMLAHGYTGRVGHPERDVPAFEDSDAEAEFFRGYFSSHYTRDTMRINGRVQPRLRFYAARAVLDRLNRHLHESIGTTLKTVQRHGRNEICYVLYYTSKREVPLIEEYLGLSADTDNTQPKETPTVRVCADPKCGNTFSPRHHRHRYCSRQCQDRHSHRLRYHRRKI